MPAMPLIKKARNPTDLLPTDLLPTDLLALCHGSLASHIDGAGHSLHLTTGPAGRTLRPRGRRRRERMKRRRKKRKKRKKRKRPRRVKRTKRRTNKQGRIR